jgi:hypothetical protein
MYSKREQTKDACTHLLTRVTSSAISHLTTAHCHRGAFAAIVAFLSFGMIQFRDGPYIRPHPAFWRIVLGLNLLYELALVFLLFQDLPNARVMMKYLDPSLGVPLPEKSYADDCSFTPKALWVCLSFSSTVMPSNANPERYRYFLPGACVRLVRKGPHHS